MVQILMLMFGRHHCEQLNLGGLRVSFYVAKTTVIKGGGLKVCANRV